MGAVAGIMFGAKALFDVIGGVKEAEAQREQAKYQKHMADLNAKLAEDQGKEAIQAGDLEANALARKADQVKGAQRVGYAGQGVDVNTGVAAEMQADTEALSQIDQVTIKTNAWRQAWGYKVEALNSRSRGEFSRIAGEKAANNTLMTAGIRGLGDVIQGASYIPKGGGGGGGATSPWYGPKRTGDAY